MRVSFFLKNVENLIEILKMEIKIEKRFSVFEIIASAVNVLKNCLKIFGITKRDFLKWNYVQSD